MNEAKLRAMEKQSMMMEAAGISDDIDALNKMCLTLAFEFNEIDLNKIYDMPYQWFKAVIKEREWRIKEEQRRIDRMKRR